LKDHSVVREALTLAEQLIAPLLRDGELEELTRFAANESQLREVAGNGIPSTGIVPISCYLTMNAGPLRATTIAGLQKL
jgi:hypothetical protein